MNEIVGKAAVEQAAIGWVIELERAAGRSPRDTRGQGAPADIESPPRVIEVKAFGAAARGQDLWLEPRQVEEARTNPDFRLYVVENIRQGDPREFALRVLSGNTLQRLLARAREHRYYTVPWPVREYDTAPVGLGPGGSGTAPIAASDPGVAPLRRPTSSGPEHSKPGVHVFRHDDAGYQRWIAANPDGFVVNAERRPRGSYLKLHMATCRFISSPARSAGAWTARDYIKVCASDRGALERWAGETTDGVLDTGCACTHGT